MNKKEFLKIVEEFNRYFLEYTKDDELARSYKPVLAYVYPKNYNGVLSYEDRVKIGTKWRDWVFENRPITEEMWDPKKDGPAVFAEVGGLSLKSRGRGYNFYKQLRKDASDMAKEIAEAARAKALWTGRGHRIPPSGKATVANRQKYGPYALPGDEEG